jgi:hypothetical protein
LHLATFNLCKSASFAGQRKNLQKTSDYFVKK